MYVPTYYHINNHSHLFNLHIFSFFGEKYNATSIVKPTHTFKGKMNITEAGIDLVLYHAPGETNDQIIVHWPEKDVLCPADNIYRAFPNLYAVRGTAAR
jgi:glyoxylase-like metal-dependent hydrolase (beta-lactamase superfamily II)